VNSFLLVTFGTLHPVMQRVEQPNALLSGHFVTFSLNPLPFLERFGDAEAVGEAKNLSHKR